jgi:hypothetical protein
MVGWDLRLGTASMCMADGITSESLCQATNAIIAWLHSCAKIRQFRLHFNDLRLIACEKFGLTLLGRIGPARAGYATVMFPVFALLISTVLEGYQWTVYAVAGLVLVTMGNILVIRGGRR